MPDKHCLKCKWYLPMEMERCAVCAVPLERDLMGAELATAQAELLAVRAERDRYKAALNEIASWGEGPEVTGSFDSPDTAKIAREALA